MESRYRRHSSDVGISFNSFVNFEPFPVIGNCSLLFSKQPRRSKYSILLHDTSCSRAPKASRSSLGGRTDTKAASL